MSLKEQLIGGTQAFFISFGPAGLFLLAFIESSVFPIPPDVVLIPMALAAPHLALVYATITTVGSVLGAIAGYYMGYKGGRPILLRFISHQNLERVEGLYDRYGVWAVGIAGFTPIPYKVFTISSGAFRMPFGQFMAASVLSRGARFFAEALLIIYFGDQIVSFLHGTFGIISLGAALIIAAAYIAWKQWF